MKRKLILIVLVFAMTFSTTGCALGLLMSMDELKEMAGGKEFKTFFEDDIAKKEKETLVVPVPAGFVKTESSDMTKYTKENIGSNIVVNTTENNGSLKAVSGKIFLPMLDKRLDDVYEEDVTLTLVKEQAIQIDGHAGYMYAFSYTAYGMEMVQTQYILENGDIYEFITFTDVVSEGYTSVFENCAKNISYK